MLPGFHLNLNVLPAKNCIGNLTWEQTFSTSLPAFPLLLERKFGSRVRPHNVHREQPHPVREGSIFYDACP